MLENLVEEEDQDLKEKTYVIIVKSQGIGLMNVHKVQDEEIMEEEDMDIEKEDIGAEEDPLVIQDQVGAIVIETIKEDVEIEAEVEAELVVEIDIRKKENSLTHQDQDLQKSLFSLFNISNAFFRSRSRSIKRGGGSKDKSRERSKSEKGNRKRASKSRS